MIIYTSEVANAINKYQKYFGVRTRMQALRFYHTEKDYVAAIDGAVKAKEPIPFIGGTYKEPKKEAMPKRRSAKAALTESISQEKPAVKPVEVKKERVRKQATINTVADEKTSISAEEKKLVRRRRKTAEKPEEAPKKTVKPKKEPAEKAVAKRTVKRTTAKKAEAEPEVTKPKTRTRRRTAVKKTAS